MCSAGRAIWRRAVTFLAPDCRRIRFFAGGTRLVCAAITPVNSSTGRPRVLSHSGANMPLCNIFCNIIRFTNTTRPHYL